MPLNSSIAVFEHLDRIDVEMVRRLVEHEQVRPRQHQQEQLEPRPLAAGEEPVRPTHLLVGEQELHQQRDGVAFGDGHCPADRGERGRGGVERVLFLGQIPDRDRRPDPDLARGGWDLADERLQKDRLAGAVAADDADPLAVHDLEVDACEHGVLTEGDTDLPQREHALPATGRGAELKRDLATLEDWPFDRVHPVDLPLLVVGLADVALVGNPRGPELEAGDRCLEPLDLLLLGHVGLLLALQLELALEGVRRVVARPEPDPAVIQRRDLVDDLVEQVAVVRDRDDRAVEAPREQLHSGATLVVEVGFGLVEQEHVGLLLEAGGERDELALPARQAAGRERQLVG